MRLPTIRSIQMEWIQRRARWHNWFAWRPVRVTDNLVWLENIERRGGFDHRKNSDARPPWRWQYRA